jgi:hypothetical protein
VSDFLNTADNVTESATAGTLVFILDYTQLNAATSDITLAWLISGFEYW